MRYTWDAKSSQDGSVMEMCRSKVQRGREINILSEIIGGSVGEWPLFLNFGFCLWLKLRRDVRAAARNVGVQLHKLRTLVFPRHASHRAFSGQAPTEALDELAAAYSYLKMQALILKGHGTHTPSGGLACPAHCLVRSGSVHHQ